MMGSAPLAGKKRSFGRGLLLTIVTLGIYAWYWHYKARHEMYAQQRRSDFPTGLYIGALVGILFFPVSIACECIYMSGWLDEINAHRRARGRAPIFGLGGFLEWYVLGALIIVGPFIAYSKLQGAINEFWDDEARTVQPPVMGATPGAAPATPPSW